MAGDVSGANGGSYAAPRFLFRFVCFSDRESEDPTWLMGSWVVDAASVCVGFMVVRNDGAVCSDVVDRGGTRLCLSVSGSDRKRSGLGTPPPGRGLPRNFFKYRDLEDCQVCFGNYVSDVRI